MAPESKAIEIVAEIIKASIKLDTPQADPLAYNVELWKKMTGHAPVVVRFYVRGDYSTAPGLPIFYWNFGDGETSSEMFPDHTYTRAGIYSVSATLKGVDWSMSTTKDRFLTVLPMAYYTMAYTIPGPPGFWAPATIKFSNWSSGEPTTFQWDFKDGSSSTEQHPTHVYDNAGIYVPCLTVWRDGLSDTLTKVGGLPGGPGGGIVTGGGGVIIMPMADFSASALSGDAPLKVRFQDLSRGSPGKHEWNFGDGSAVSNGTNPEHTFDASGTFTVTLTVSTGNLAHQKTLAIVVKPSSPPAPPPTPTPTPTPTPPPVTTFTIGASAGTGGSITPSGSVKVKSGTDQTFIWIAQKGYAVKTILVDGKPIKPEDGYTFYRVKANHTIQVTFRKYQVRAVA